MYLAPPKITPAIPAISYPPIFDNISIASSDIVNFYLKSEIFDPCLNLELSGFNITNLDTGNDFELEEDLNFNLENLEELNEPLNQISEIDDLIAFLDDKETTEEKIEFF